LDINRKIGNRYSLSQTYLNLGGLYVEIEDFEQALQSYSKALEIGESLRIPEIIWEANYGIGLINQKSGENSFAKDRYKKAIQTFDKIREKIITGEQKSHFYKDKISVHKDLINLLFQDYQENKDKRILEVAFYYAEHAKARTLLDILFESKIKINKGVNPKIIDKQTQIFRNISKIRTDLLKDDISENQRHQLNSDLNIEEENLDKLQHKLKTENPAYANLNYPKPSRLTEIQNSIVGEGDLLLEYLLAEPNSFLWVISKDNASFFILPGEKEIGKNVNEYLSIISKPPSDNQISNESGEKLFQNLLSPITTTLQQHQNLVIIPDGILYYLPFESLIIESENNLPVYLVENYNTRYAPSASVLMWIKQENQKSNSNQEIELVAFGDPVFDARIETNEAINDENILTYNVAERSIYENTGFNFRRLPYTGVEVKEIASLFNSDKISINLRENASEEKFKAMNPIDSRIIHFASHGLLNEKHPNRSCIVLTLDDNPVEDGFLQMNEIFNLEINSELAVLSACQTGGGKLVHGEGVIGLTRAFLYAGVSSVVVSLWTVNDRSTTQIMSNFYKYLQQDISIDEALRKARNDLLKGEIASLRHPYYWAPFIFIGNSY
jgi:CHAT domain-containing protein